MYSKNAHNGFVNYMLWIKWYSGDCAGAIEFAGLQLDTEQDVDDLTIMIRELEDARLREVVCQTC